MMNIIQNVFQFYKHTICYLDYKILSNIQYYYIISYS